MASLLPLRAAYQLTMCRSTLCGALLMLLGWLAAPQAAHAQSWQWAKTFVPDTTRSPSTSPTDVAIDATGNIYSTGSYAGMWARFGATTIVSPPGITGGYYVAKQNPAGNWLWAISSPIELCEALTIDGAGNLLLAGEFSGTRTLGGSTIVSHGNNDVVVAKLDGTTGAVLWASSGGGTDRDYANGIAIDAANNVFIVGDFQSTTAALGTTTLLNHTTDGHLDILVAKLNGATGAWQWAVSGGSTDHDVMNGGIAVDAAGDVLIGGSCGANAQFGATTLAGFGDWDVLVAKLAGGTGAWQWAVSGGGSGTDTAIKIAVDAAGNAFISGGQQSASATYGASTLSNIGVIVAKLDGATGAWQWSAGGAYPGTSSGNDIVVDAAGNPSITGSFSGGAVAFGSCVLASVAADDALVAKLDGVTGAWRWVLGGGGTGDDYGFHLAQDGLGDLVVAGVYTSRTVAFGATTLPNGTGTPGVTTFVAKVQEIPWISRFLPTQGAPGTVVTFSGQGMGSVTAVSFNGIPAPGFTVNAARTQLTVPVPPGAVTGIVTLQAARGDVLTTRNFVVTAPTGLSDEVTDFGFTLSPNPATSTVALLLAGTQPEAPTAVVLDGLGRVVGRQSLAPKGEATLLKLENLPAGLYFVRVGAQVRRLVVR